MTELTREERIIAMQGFQNEMLKEAGVVAEVGKVGKRFVVKAKSAIAGAGGKPLKKGVTSEGVNLGVSGKEQVEYFRLGQKAREHRGKILGATGAGTTALIMKDKK